MFIGRILALKFDMDNLLQQTTEEEIKTMNYLCYMNQSIVLLTFAISFPCCWVFNRIVVCLLKKRFSDILVSLMPKATLQITPSVSFCKFPWHWASKIPRTLHCCTQSIYLSIYLLLYTNILKQRLGPPLGWTNQRLFQSKSRNRLSLN